MVALFSFDVQNSGLTMLKRIYDNTLIKSLAEKNRIRRQCFLIKQGRKESVLNYTTRVSTKVLEIQGIEGEYLSQSNIATQ